MNQPTEQEIQKSILDYLKLKRVLAFKFRSVGIRKENGSYIPMRAGEVGISDILGCLPNGRFLAIEVKRPGNRATADQLTFLANVQRCGGLAFVACSIDDVQEAGI